MITAFFWISYLFLKDKQTQDNQAKIFIFLFIDLFLITGLLILMQKARGL